MCLDRGIETFAKCQKEINSPNYTFTLINYKKLEFQREAFFHDYASKIVLTNFGH